MSKYLILTRIMIKNGSDSSNSKTKSKIKKTTLWIAVILALLPAVILFGNIISSIYDYLYKINLQHLIISSGISFISIFIFFFAIAFSLNIMYFSKDIDNFLFLPLKPWEILSSKLTLVVIYEYVAEAFMLLPVLLVYGFKSGAGVLYFIYAVFIFLTVPLIPVMAASILNMIIMSFTNLGRYRDKLKVLGGILGMAFAVGINVFIQRMGVANGSYENMLKSFSQGNNSIISLSLKLFPQSDIAAGALFFSSEFKGFLEIILYAVLNIAIFLLFLVLGEKLYFKGAIGGNEVSSISRKMDYSRLVSKTGQKSIFAALLSQEMKTLFRTPVYFINCIVSSFIVPIIFFIPVLSQPGGFNELYGYISTQANESTILAASAISAAVGMVLGALNSITSTAISREGKNIFIKKYIPVQYGMQIMVKVFSGALIGIFTSAVTIAALKIIIGVSFYFMVIMFAASISGIIFTSFTGVLVDLMFPKLNWDNEVKAVKQNFNSFINVIIALVAAGIVSFSAIRFHHAAAIIVPVEFVVLVVFDYVLYKIAIKEGTDIFKNIE